MDLLDLADKCEEAGSRDRELDARIHCYLKGRDNFVWQGHYYTADGVPNLGGDEVPQFTNSVDAALTLAQGLRGLSLHTRSNPHMGGKDYIVSAGSNRAEARSWALGLCAVGLRDRAKWATPVSNGDR
jgi:hypothetical protein